jgi:CheY-like chemotaxis protein
MMALATELIKALTSFAWPLILAILLWRLFPALKGIVTSRDFNLKIAGMEVSVQDATDQFRTQIDDLQKQVILLRAGQKLNEASSESSKVPAPSAVRKSPSILWVDDKPAGNAVEIAQLRDRGIDIVQAASTNEAMAILNSHSKFDAIISDMGRREGGEYRSQAGLILLNAIKRSGHYPIKRTGDKVPFYVYSSPKYAARNKDEVKAAGGEGATASPLELREWIDGMINRE